MTLLESNQAEDKTEEFQRLIPRIPDDITITEIAARLPWKALHLVSSLSRSWRQAIQGHHVYDARVRHKCAQTLVALLHRVSDDFRTIGLYSVEDGSCCYLPPIPGVKGGIPMLCSCISLDGKLYVLGGLKDPGNLDDDSARAEVYVLDVAGQRKWIQCASMDDPRRYFGCCAKDGKIYVFGGCHDRQPICGSEVYDPKANTWSPITPMPSFRFGHRVTVVGEELFMHDGACYPKDFFERPRNYVVDSDDDDDDDVELSSAFCLEIYHPNKDEWRVVEHFSSDRVEVVLMVGGKVHRLRLDDIQVYDIDAGSWSDPQPCSFDGPAPHDSVIGRIAKGPIAAVAVEDEVLAMFRWNTRDAQGGIIWKTCLIKSEGFGAKSKEIVWRRLPCSLDLTERTTYFMHAIHL